MAKSDNAPSFDELESVSDGTDDNQETYKMDPGEQIVAQIRHIERNVGQYNNTLLHLTLNTGEMITMWSNNTISNAIETRNAGPGDWLGIEKAEDTFSFETDDGEEREAYSYEVRVQGDE